MQLKSFEQDFLESDEVTFLFSLGMSAWLAVEFMGGDDPLVPAQLHGLAASLIGMFVGPLAPQWIDTLPPIDTSMPLPTPADVMHDQRASGYQGTVPK